MVVYFTNQALSTDVLFKTNAEFLVLNLMLHKVTSRL